MKVLYSPSNLKDVNNWLKFYEVSSPLTVLSVFISRDPDLDLRVEHSHGWGLDGKQGGELGVCDVPCNIVT